MVEQKEMLIESDWNVLIVLDACRSDSYHRRDHSSQAKRSMAWCTYLWVQRLARLLDGQEVLYVTANPVVDRELNKLDASSFHLISVWDFDWGRCGPHKMPTVHPRSVNDAVLSYVDAHGQPERMVVHYIQPHMPYIGRDALPYADWGRCDAEMAYDLRKVAHPRQAVKRGEVSREQVRAAYEGNVDLVVPYAHALRDSLAGIVVITADHGELLGERGKYGHSSGPCPELLNVPWVFRYCGPFVPKPIPEAS